MSANTEYVRGKIEERAGAMSQRAPARFTPRGNDVWAERSGRTFMSGGANDDFSSPVTGNGMGNISRLVGGGRRKARGGKDTGFKSVDTSYVPAAEQAKLDKYYADTYQRDMNNADYRASQSGSMGTTQNELAKRQATAGAAQGVDFLIDLAGMIPEIGPALQSAGHALAFIPGQEGYDKSFMDRLKDLPKDLAINYALQLSGNAAMGLAGKAFGKAASAAARAGLTEAEAAAAAAARAETSAAARAAAKAAAAGESKAAQAAAAKAARAEASAAANAARAEAANAGRAEASAAARNAASSGVRGEELAATRAAAAARAEGNAARTAMTPARALPPAMRTPAAAAAREGLSAPGAFRRVAQGISNTARSAGRAVSRAAKAAVTKARSAVTRAAAAYERAMANRALSAAERAQYRQELAAARREYAAASHASNVAEQNPLSEASMRSIGLPESFDPISVEESARRARIAEELSSGQGTLGELPFFGDDPTGLGRGRYRGGMFGRTRIAPAPAQDIVDDDWALPQEVRMEFNDSEPRRASARVAPSNAPPKRRKRRFDFLCPRGTTSASVAPAPDASGKGRYRGGMSPDYETLNLLQKGQMAYEGGAKPRLTKLEKEALEMAEEAKQMGHSLEEHLAMSRVPAAKRRTLARRVANAVAKGAPGEAVSSKRAKHSKPGASKRGQAVAAIMREQGLSLPAASRYLKEHPELLE